MVMLQLFLPSVKLNDYMVVAAGQALTWLVVPHLRCSLFYGESHPKEVITYVISCQFHPLIQLQLLMLRLYWPSLVECGREE